MKVLSYHIYSKLLLLKQFICKIYKLTYQILVFLLSFLLFNKIKKSILYFLLLIISIITIEFIVTINNYHYKLNSIATKITPTITSTLLSPGSIEQVAVKVVPSVVKLESGIGQEGSGIILTTDGLILTNNHVVQYGKSDMPYSTLNPLLNNKKLNTHNKVTFFDGVTRPFIVIGSDPSSDIAIVRAQNISDLTPITLGCSANLRVGQNVVAIGSPLGLESTVTNGIISALNRPVATSGDLNNQNTVLDAIQTDASINPGNSGGALVNMNGELIGINSAIATMGWDLQQTQAGSIGLGFAIPIDPAKRITDELIKNGIALHASLGVQVSNSTANNGAKIVEISSDGAAAEANLPNGVIVTKVNDRFINNANALVAAVRSRAPGEIITITYIDQRNIQLKTIEITLKVAEQ